MNVHRFFALALLSVPMLLLAGPTVIYADTLVPPGAITKDTTWTPAGSPYVLEGSISVPAGLTLTVQAGVIVKLKLPADLVVSGRLEALGAPGQPVTFTSYLDDSQGDDTDGSPSTGQPGDWGSLKADTGGRIVLDHAVVRYGGGGVAAEGALGTTGGGLDISNSTVEYARQYGVWVTGGELSIRDSVISGTVKSNEGGNADGIGLYMSANGDVAPVISNTRFIGNEGPAGYLDLGSVALDASRISGNTAEGNGGNGLWLGATFTGTSVMVNAGVPYVNYISGLIVDPGVVLTIERGTVLKSRSNGVAVGGALNATGQAGEEVIFTSLYDDAYGGRTDPSAPAPASGQWTTLQARGSGRIVLDHTVVRFGGVGEGAAGSSGGTLEISSSTVEYSRQYGVWVSDGQLSIRDSVISGTTTGAESGTGLYLSGSGAVAPVISGTRFLNNEGYAGYLALGSVSLDASGISGNTAEGNVSNGLSLVATFTGASVVVNAGIPYVIETPGLTVDPGAVLTIDRGTVVKSAGDGVTVDGALHATGQDGEEVVFTSFYDDDYGGDTDGGGGPPAGGDWAKLLSNTGGQIVLDHTIARYGGANDGGVVGSSGGDLEVSDSMVEYGAQWG